MKESAACHYFLIDQLPDKEQPFFLYRSPASAVTLALFRKEEAIPLASINQLDGKEGFVIAPFLLAAAHPLWLLTNPVLLEGEDALVHGLSRLGLIPDPKAGDQKDSDLISPVPFDEGLTTYQQAFKSLHQALKENICQKVVLSRAISYPRSPDFSPVMPFTKQCKSILLRLFFYFIILRRVYGWAALLNCCWAGKIITGKLWQWPEPNLSQLIRRLPIGTTRTGWNNNTLPII